MDLFWLGLGLTVVLIPLVVGIAMLVSWSMRVQAPVQQQTSPAAPAAGAGTATANATPNDWNLGWPTSPFWRFIAKLLATILVLGVAGFGLFWIFQWLPQSSIATPKLSMPTLPQGTAWDKLYDDPLSIVLAVFAVVVLITAFIVGNRMKLVTFLFVTVLLLFVYAQYYLGSLGLGYRREILYLLAIAATIMVIEYTVGKEKFTFGLLVGAILTLLGFSHIYTWGEFTNKLGSTASWSGGASPEPIFSTATQCGVEIPTPVVVSSSATLLTTGAKCDVTLHVVVGRVRVEGEHGRGYMILDPTGLVEKDIYPGWRAVTIRSIEPGTKVTGRVF